MASAQQVVVHDDDEATSPRQVVPAGAIAGSADAASDRGVSTSEYELFALLTELIELTILDEGSPQSFRARAYQRALSTLRDSDADLASASQAELTALDGVGAATAKKVREYFQTGTIDKLERLRADFPAGVRELARIPGLGPKTLIRLREELGIESVADLSAAVASGAVASLSGLGEKFASRMSTGIERIEEAGKQSRVPLSRALPLAEAIVAEVGELAGVAAVEPVGVPAGVLRQHERDQQLAVETQDSNYADALGRIKELFGLRSKE